MKLLKMSHLYYRKTKDYSLNRINTIEQNNCVCILSLYIYCLDSTLINILYK